MNRWLRRWRRNGRRATVTVPHPLYVVAQRVADRTGITTDEALICLAEEGAASRARRAQIEAIARARREAIDSMGLDYSDLFLSPDESRAAVLSDRYC